MTLGDWEKTPWYMRLLDRKRFLKYRRKIKFKGFYYMHDSLYQYFDEKEV